MDWDTYGTLSNSQSLFHTIGFYRDPNAGLFGVDVGLYSLGYDIFANADDSWSFVRAGGVLSWYASDMITLTGFGGGLFGIDKPFDDQDDGEGWYIGGHTTFYA